jgi:hypothetical protein
MQTRGRKHMNKANVRLLYPLLQMRQNKIGFSLPARLKFYGCQSGGPAEAEAHIHSTLHQYITSRYRSGTNEGLKMTARIPIAE